MTIQKIFNYKQRQKARLVASIQVLIADDATILDDKTAKNLALHYFPNASNAFITWVQQLARYEICVRNCENALDELVSKYRPSLNEIKEIEGASHEKE